MSTPPFDPQPCCGGGGAEVQDVNVLNTVTVAEPVDVNVLGTVTVAEPVTVDGTVSINDPIDVNVLGTVAVAEPIDVNVLGTVPVSGSVSVLGTVPVSGTVGISGTVPVQIIDEPVDVNVLGTVPVSGTITAQPGGSTAATNTLTAVTTGTGTTVDFLNAKSNVTMMIRVNGTATGGICVFEGSHDGTNWVTIATSAAFATGVNQYLSLTGGAFRWFRGRITTNVAGGGNVTVTLMFA